MTTDGTQQGNYAPINGLNLYYQIHGSGQPLVMHVVEFFGLLGGGKGDGDMGGVPASALAILPATTHVGWAPPFHGIMNRTQLLVPIITEFLDASAGNDQASV